jgi:hypothetical protein
MKITELIVELQRELEAHGDVDVAVAMEITETGRLSYWYESGDPSVFIDGGRLVIRGEADY